MTGKIAIHKGFTVKWTWEYKGVTELQGINCCFTNRAIFCRTSEEAGLTLLGRVEEGFPKEMTFDLSLEAQRREAF